MSGFYGGTLVDDPNVRALGVDAYPAATGEVHGSVFDQALHDNPIAGAYRLARDQMERNVLPNLAREGLVPRDWVSPMMTADEANERYPIPGKKLFTSSVPESIAQSVYDAQAERIARQRVIDRRAGGIATGMVAQFGTQIAASALDPLNIAASLIPVAPAAKMAAILARQGSAAGRSGVRAAAGAGQGALGAAVLEPIVAAATLQESNDYTMASAALNLATGAALGGLINPLVGRFSAAEREFRRPRVSPEAHQAALGDALVAQVEGRPTVAAEVGEAVSLREADAAFRERAMAVGLLEQDAARLTNLRAGEFSAVAQYSLPARENIGAPVSLLEFVGSRGGVQEQGGDLRAIGADVHFVPGYGRVVRRNGMTLDYMREAAEEAGYIGPNSTIADFLDAVAEEVAGRRVYLPHEYAVAHERWQARLSEQEADRFASLRQEVEDVAGEYGIRLTPAEADQATMKILDGATPDAAIRDVTVGSELDAMGMADDATVDASIRLAEIDAENRAISQATKVDPEYLDFEAEAARLDADAPKASGPVSEQLAELEKSIADLDTIIQAERSAGRLGAEDDAALRLADDQMKLAESDAKAMEAAGFCLAVRA